MPGGSGNDFMSDILFELIKTRYGNRLTMQQLDEVRIGVQGAEDLAKELRGVRLNNADEPFALFQPYLGADNNE